jgi:hypothetical protein
MILVLAGLELPRKLPADLPVKFAATTPLGGASS